MPAAVTDVDTLKIYIEGVMGRAQHHAQSVAGMALLLAGAIIWKKDAKPIEVMAQSGDMKNVLWVWIKGKRYAFSYNHTSGQIEMRQGTTQGPLLHAFNDQQSVQTVLGIFSQL